MKLLVDEDTKSHELMGLLKARGHDAESTQTLGIDSADDPDVFEAAQKLGRTVLTKNTEDYRALHQAALASGESHHGVLAVFQYPPWENKNMSDEQIAQAVDNVRAALGDIPGQFHSLNAWNFPPPKPANDSNP